MTVKTKTQKDVFTNGGEGDGWFERNRITGQKLQEKKKTDPLLALLYDTPLTNERVLEVGASNGWRLSALKEKFSALECYGIEPSAKAVKEALPDINLRIGTADSLPYDDACFDIVVFGFCLYLCDRSDLFQIAAEADRVLKDGGLLFTYDFHPDTPYRNPYSHQEGVYSYKMDYSTLFSWNPSYRFKKQIKMAHPGYDKETPDNRIAVTILQKDLSLGWPDNPHKK